MARILIVDDSDLARRMMRRILEPAGHEVSEARDGIGALERYSVERPDVVMLDLVMRGLPGMDVLTRLRELDPEASVVIATADVQTATQQLATQLGARAFLTKPYAAHEVLGAVDSALSGGANGNRTRTRRAG